MPKARDITTEGFKALDQVFIEHEGCAVRIETVPGTLDLRIQYSSVSKKSVNTATVYLSLTQLAEIFQNFSNFVKKIQVEHSSSELGVAK